METRVRGNGSTVGHASPPVAVHVNDLGPIRSGEIELRPLTILLGGNNTGKTVFAKTIDAVIGASRHLSYPAVSLTWDETRVLRDAAKQWKAGTPFALPDSVRTRARQWLKENLLDVGYRLPWALDACLGVGRLADMTRWGCPTPPQVNVASGNVHLFGTDPDMPAPQPEVDSLLVPNPSMMKEFARMPDTPEQNNLERTLASTDLSWNIGTEHRQRLGLAGKSHFLPSTRSGLIQGWNLTEGRAFELVEKDAYKHMKTLSSSPPGQPPRDMPVDHNTHSFGVDLYRIVFHSKTSPHPDLEPALMFLREAMGGQVVFGDTPTLLFSPDEPDGQRLPYHLAGSVVTELAPLALWVKHLVKPGSTLIVDQPEKGLHPSAIRTVAKALTCLANRNVRVVVITHSSVLLHQISNSMLGSQLSNPPTDSVSFDDIGVWRFANTGTGVETEQVHVKPDWGIPEDDFVRAAENMSNESARLVRQLQA